MPCAISFSVSGPFLTTARDKLKLISPESPRLRHYVRVALRLREGKLQADVNLPGGTEGEFVWKGLRKPLAPGENRLVF